MPVVDIPDVGAVEFPESMSMGDINSAAEELYLQKTMPAEAEALKKSDEQADLLAQQTAAARSGGYWEGVAERAGKLYDFVVEPLTRPISGAFGRAADVLIPGAPVVESTIQQAGIHLPKAGEAETTGGKIAAGTYNAVADLIGALSSPDMVALFPAAANRTVLASWVSQMAAHQPERAIHAAALFKEGKTQEAVQEVMTGVGEVTMAGLGTRHLLKGDPVVAAPRTYEAVKQSSETLKTGEAPLTEAQIEGKTIEIKPPETLPLELSPTQQIIAASAKVKSNAADAIGSVKLALDGVRQQIEAARALPAQAATEAAASASKTLEAGKTAPAQASADMIQRAQDALNRADDIFGLVEGGEVTGAAVKPADLASVLDTLAEAVKPLSQPVPPIVKEPKEGGVVEPAIPNDLASLTRLKSEVESRLDEIEIFAREKTKGTIFEGQTSFEPSAQTRDLLTQINTKIADLKPKGGDISETPKVQGQEKVQEGVLTPKKAAVEPAPVAAAIPSTEAIAKKPAGTFRPLIYKERPVISGITGEETGGNAARLVWKSPTGKFRVSYTTMDAISRNEAPRGHDDYSTLKEAQEAAKASGAFELEAAATPSIPVAEAIKGLPPVPPGHTRLFHGEGGPQGGGTGGANYASSVEKASTFGPDISWVDVPYDVAQVAFNKGKASPNSGGDLFILEAADINRSQKLAQKVETPTHVLDEQITEKTVTDLADTLGVKWDDDPAFMARTKVLTGKEHLSKLSTAELQKVLDDLNKPSGKGIGIIPEGTQLTMDTVGNAGWWSRYFTSQRGLPEGVPEAWLKRMGEVRSETRGATYAARDLANALREEYNIGVGRLAVGGLSDVPKPTMDAIQRVLTGQADINSLPVRFREPVGKIREHVDALSTQIMEKLGEENPLTAKIGENLGVYLTRSYRIFDDPKWIEKIPVEVRNQAEAFLADQLGERAEVPATEMRDAAKTKLREMLADWSDNGLDKLMRSGKLGSKDLSLFMQRKDIAPSIRAVMGEYGDPVTNYIRSITKMSRWIGDQEFLNKVRELGMGRWLFEEGNSPAGFEHKLAAESSDAMSPLNGLRTSEAIKDVFENFNKSKVSDNLIARAYFAINAWSKQAKTVFSALTQARNFIGNPFFNVKSGHFNFQDYGKAFKTQLADIAGSDKTAQEFYKEMTKYGLVDENPVVGELRASIRDAGLQDPSFEDYSMKGAARALRLAIETPQRAYRLPDEMGKTVGWLAEQKDLRSSHPDWTDAQVKQEAATRVRNEYPTYSMIPEAVQQFRKQPIVGPFVNFAYETVRNGYWALRNGSTDLFAGDNAAQRRHGARKLGGFATVLASGTALTKIGQQLFNIDGESEEDIRRFLPDYSKNNELLIYDKDGTKLRYINYSYLNPYSQMTDPFVAALSNDQPGIINGAAAAFGEFIKPFANEQMLAGAIKEVTQNRDSNDNRIYNPQDDGNVIFQKVTERLLRSIEPGSIERFRRRIWPAITGEPWPSGDERNLGLEVFSELSGLRMEQKDLTKLFGFKVREFVEEDMKDARKLATSVLFSSKTPTTEEGLAAYQKADDARFQLWKSLYLDYSAIVRQGGEPAEIKKIFDSVKMSQSDVGKLMSGNYEPLEIEANDYIKSGREPQPEIVAEIQVERGKRMGRQLVEEKK